MIKPIKFDLKLNDGTKLATLDDLEENLSPALFEHFHSGKLAKWLRVRKLEDLAEKVEALSTEHLADKNELDVKLFKNLCEIFVSEVDLEDAREAVTDYKVAVSTDENSIDSEEIEQLKAENQALKAEIEELKNQSIDKNETKTVNDELANMERLELLKEELHSLESEYNRAFERSLEIHKEFMAASKKFCDHGMAGGYFSDQEENERLENRMNFLEREGRRLDDTTYELRQKIDEIQFALDAQS